MSVNELVQRLGDLAQSRWDSWRNGAGMDMQGQSDAYDVAANMVAEVAHTAWHPVSEPPTEADGDRNNSVFVCYGGDDFEMQDIQDYCRHSPEGTKWARVSDVLLMPPQGGE